MDKSLGALCQGIHLLILDLHPPGKIDPNGIHNAIWERLAGEKTPIPDDYPLTMVAYEGGASPRGYLEPVAVGQMLKDMPLFLQTGGYVNVPLESTYRAAYQGLPQYYQRILEAPST